MNVKILKFCLSIALSSAFLSSCNDGGNTKPSTDEEIKLIDPATYTGEKITLRYWNGFTGEDGEGMKKIIRSFNEEFKDKIEVQMETFSWDILFTKLISSKNSPSTAPHLVAMPANRATGYIAKNLFSDISSIEKAMNVTKEQYVESAWEAGYYGKKARYTFPLDIHPTAMFYNKDLVDESEIPSTWESFLSLCKSKTHGTNYGFAIPNLYSVTKDLFLSRLVQNGGKVFDENNKITFNSNIGIKVLQEMVDWKYVDKISPEEVGADGDKTLFSAGKSAFYFDGPWVINQLDKISSLDYGVAPMPGSIGDNGVSWAGSHQLGLCSVTTTSNQLLSAGYTLIDHISKNSLLWAQSGQVPALKAVHEEPEYKKLSKLEAFTKEALKATFGKLEYKYCYEGYNFVGAAVSNALNKTSTPAESLNKQAGLLKIYIEEDE